MGWGKDRPKMGDQGKKIALPGTKIKRERNERNGRDASVQAKKVAKGKNW
jgi:hypothetical protein